MLCGKEALHTFNRRGPQRLRKTNNILMTITRIDRWRTLLTLLLFAGVSVMGQSPTPPTKSPQRGAIKGRVVNEGGHPLPNARVLIMGMGAMRANQETTTDREGKFEVDGLAATPYRVHAQLAGYVTPPRALGDTQENRYHIGDSVTLVLTKGGVITGTVTTQTGEPIVGIRVRARMIADVDRQVFPLAWYSLERATDDRGVYRIYGVPEGKYVVWAGGASGPGQDPYDADVPTFAPSSNRDTAEEIVVRAGGETPNVDIRYRGEPGRTISGSVKNSNVWMGVSVTLTSPADKDWLIVSPQYPGSQGFSFYGVDDGDYDVTARAPQASGEWLLSPSKRIKVRGADVTGIELIAQPLAAVSGRVVLDETKATECTDKQQPVMTETVVSAWHNETEATKDLPSYLWGIGAPVNADEQGNVTLRNLAPGEYHFRTQLSAKLWYVKSITLAAQQAKAAPIDATRNWTTVKYGDRLSGLTITLAHGAASLRGQLAIPEDEMPPQNLFAYLVPAEKERADEALRFSAAPVPADGKISINNIAPGRYWIVVQPGPQLTRLRLPGETPLRAKLRREAEAAKNEIELKPCQSVSDLKLRLK